MKEFRELCEIPLGADTISSSQPGWQAVEQGLGRSLDPSVDGYWTQF